MAIVTLPEVSSTNSWAKEHASALQHGDVVLTHCQTAGRGQRGNKWEAAPGRNLTFSMFLRPVNLRPSEQFTVSEVIALAVIDTLRDAFAESIAPERITVKWPNDIYVDDRKIAGILIEHAISGMSIGHSIAGIGLNVNQSVFLSDAPNPVSMTQLTGTEFSLDELLGSIRHRIARMLAASDKEAIHKLFLQNLWRNDRKPHRFQTPDGEIFEAVIANVSATGMLKLRLNNGSIKEFAFKEIAFML